MSDSQGSSSSPFLLACIALLASLVALGGVAYLALNNSNPLGKGLASYDFSSPEAALKSQLQINMNRDISAMMELEGKLKSAAFKKQLDTLEVKKIEDWNDKEKWCSTRMSGTKMMMSRSPNPSFWMARRKRTTSVTKPLSSRSTRKVASGIESSHRLIA